MKYIERIQDYLNWESETVPPGREPILRFWSTLTYLLCVSAAIARLGSWLLPGAVLMVGIGSSLIVRIRPSLLFQDENDGYAPFCIFFISITSAGGILLLPLYTPAHPMGQFLSLLMGLVFICFFLRNSLSFLEYRIMGMMSLFALLLGISVIGSSISLLWMLGSVLFVFIQFMLIEQSGVVQQNYEPDTGDGTLNTTSISASGEKAPSSLPGLSDIIRWCRNLLKMGGAATIALLVGLLLFMSFPRLSWIVTNEDDSASSSRSNEIGRQVTLRVPGPAPDQLKIDHLTSLKTNSIKIMRVKVLNEKKTGKKLEHPFYLRSRVYSHYSKSTWYSQEPFYQKQTGAVKGNPSWIQYPGAASGTSKNKPVNTVEIDVLYERTGYLHIPYGTQWLEVSIPYVEQSNTGELRVPKDLYPDFYRVRSQIPNPDNHRIPVLTENNLSPNRYKQMPSWNHKRRYRRIAEEIAEENKGRLTRAHSIEQYLRSDRFEYSLNFSADSRTAPLLSFLTKSRRGYCTHFASSMVLLLRSLDIPARLVGGYAVRTWNSRYRAYDVKSIHAHAWVEVLTRDNQWVLFDPTPSGPAFSPAENRSENPTGVGGDQNNLQTSVGENSRNRNNRPKPDFGVDPHDSTKNRPPRFGPSDLADRVGSLGRNVPLWLLMTVVVLFAALGYFLLFPGTAKQIGNQFKKTTDPTNNDQKLIQLLKKNLKKEGIPVRKSATPKEWLQEITNPDIQRKAASVVRAYYRSRFGGKELTGKQRKNLSRLARLNTE